MPDKINRLSTTEMLQKIICENNSSMDIHLKNMRDWMNQVEECKRLLSYPGIYVDHHKRTHLQNEIANLTMLIDSGKPIITKIQQRLLKEDMKILKMKSEQSAANVSAWNGMYYKMMGLTASCSVVFASSMIYLGRTLFEDTTLGNFVTLLGVGGVLTDSIIRSNKGMLSTFVKSEIEATSLEILAGVMTVKDKQEVEDEKLFSQHSKKSKQSAVSLSLHNLLNDNDDTASHSRSNPHSFNINSPSYDVNNNGTRKITSEENHNISHNINKIASEANNLSSAINKITSGINASTNQNTSDEKPSTMRKRFI